MHESDRTPVARGKLADEIKSEAAVGGRPLGARVRRALERSFGLDLSAIRVHDNPRADRLARSIRADAFAAGPHLFFRTGTYRPETEPGLWLLAHEVAHSVQQAEARRRQNALAENAEGLADRAAGRVLAGKAAPVAGGLEAVGPMVADGDLVVQRHGSWEHRLLGDATPTDLDIIAGQKSGWKNLVEGLIAYLDMWRSTPDVTADQIREKYPYIRTHQLKASGLLVTYGELNTLPDYIANAGAIDDLPRDILLPILQAVRQEGCYKAVSKAGIDLLFAKFTGSVSATLCNGTLNDIWESYWLDQLSSNLPADGVGSMRQSTDSYGALLARNACHFAPYSWYRWEQSYDMALQKAHEYHQTRDPAAQHAAWIHHGYADHFLQDSFAAGHLINKTLVMQWFVEWAAPQAFVSVPDWVEVQTMTADRQPGLAASGLYTPADPGFVRDPQTSEEQHSRDARMAMSGVRADGPISQVAAYQNYLIFLNNAIVQGAPLSLHDYLNNRGLFVASEDQKTPFEIFGDGTMLNGGEGVRIACETAHMSQQSIQDVLDTGTTAVAKDVIRRRFPTAARTESGETVTLQQWNESMKARAFTQFSSVHDVVLSMVHQKMGHVSQDQDFFLVHLAQGGKEGYLGRTSGEWATLVDKEHATKLRRRTFNNQTYYGTEDGWWLSVGTALGRRGSVGFWWWRNSGEPDWQYDEATKRLTSSYFNRVGMSIGDDGYLYCWDGYAPAETRVETVDAWSPNFGHPWHTIRMADGSWSGTGDPKMRETGPISAVAAASGDPEGMQFLFASKDGGLWHTDRKRAGDWAWAGDVKSQIGNQGTVTAVAAAGGENGDVHFFYATVDGRLWHTTHQKSGFWTAAFDVKSSIGGSDAITAVAAANTGQGMVDVFIGTESGVVLHTTRKPQGEGFPGGASWSPAVYLHGGGGGNDTPLKAISAATVGNDVHLVFSAANGVFWHMRRPADPNPVATDISHLFGNQGPVAAVTAASAASGEMQVLYATANGRLWHHMLRGDGEWTGAGDVKAVIGDKGPVHAVSAASAAPGDVQFFFAT